jgi:hypothetical protein
VQDWVASQTKRNAKYDEPFTKKEMERAVATCRHTKLATLLTLSELIKAGGSALVKLLLKLVNWVWELETLPTAWSQIVNLFKAGDSCQGITGDHPGINLPQDVYKHVAQAHGVPRTCTRGSGGVQKQRSCTDNLFVLTRILQEAGKANKTVYAFFLTRV